MRITVSTAALVSLIGLAALGASSAAASVPVDIHVVTNDGAQLANLRQYAPSAAKVRTFAGDDCIDPTPPAKQSSGQTYTQSAPNMLSAVDEASDATPSLQPFRISDADFATFGSLTICSIGVGVPPGFWYQATNHVADTAGADQTFIKPGDQLTSIGHRLISPPMRSSPSTRLLEPPGCADHRSGSFSQTDGTAGPGSGATVTGGDTPAPVDGAAMRR